MLAHRGGRDEEGGPDLAVRPPACDETEHLALARGERVGRFFVNGVAVLPVATPDQGEMRREHRENGTVSLAEIAPTPVEDDASTRRSRLEVELQDIVDAERSAHPSVQVCPSELAERQEVRDAERNGDRRNAAAVVGRVCAGNRILREQAVITAPDRFQTGAFHAGRVPAVAILVAPFVARCDLARDQMAKIGENGLRQRATLVVRIRRPQEVEDEAATEPRGDRLNPVAGARTLVDYALSPRSAIDNAPARAAPRSGPTM